MRLQVFSHGTTALLSCDVKNFVVISLVRAKTISRQMDMMRVHENTCVGYYVVTLPYTAITHLHFFSNCGLKLWLKTDA